MTNKDPQSSSSAQLPEIPWVAAADNPWGVPLLDVRPITLTMLSTSTDPHFAANAASFAGDDGTGFIGVRPTVARRAEAALKYPVDRMLADGALFVPQAMEQKWALYYHRSQIYCVRSWRREVLAVAEVRTGDGWAEVTAVDGVLTAASPQDEAPAFTVRVFDFLLHSHALDLVYPAPLPAGMEADPGQAALWCMSCFGNRAHVATPYELRAEPPAAPLRTDSLLHIAAARGDLAAARAQLDAGVPADLLARDGLAPLHWALASDDTAVYELLIERASVDVRSLEGATPLMNAVQARSPAKATFLLDRGADPNAQDQRGFTALHRAAEMGEVEIVRLLLARGAAPDVEAQGHTPRSLAEGRGQKAILALLDRA